MTYLSNVTSCWLPHLQPVCPSLFYSSCIRFSRWRCQQDRSWPSRCSSSPPTRQLTHRSHRSPLNEPEQEASLLIHTARTSSPDTHHRHDGRTLDNLCFKPFPRDTDWLSHNPTLDSIYVFVFLHVTAEHVYPLPLTTASPHIPPLTSVYKFQRLFLKP